ncbi:MAG: c-type cytochrome [Roseobacter sp.]
MTLPRTAMAFGLAASLAACAPETTTDTATRTDTARGAEVYATNCVACHGADGRGNGPKAANLSPTPPNLHQISARNGGSFPRDEVMSTIDGYTRSDKGAAMPEFGAGDLGPLVQVEVDGISTPIPADLLALTDYLETLQE